MNISNPYIDATGVICIPIIITVFAFAWPLLLQIVAKIDDKYNSTLLIETFRKDRNCLFFIYSLLISLLIVVIWLFQFIGNTGHFIIDNSALLLLVITTLFLVVATIRIIYLTYVYYVPNLLFKRLEKQYNSRQEDKRTLYFMAISRVMFYCIQNSDENLANNILDFYRFSFEEFRKNKRCQLPHKPDRFRLDKK